MMQVNKDTPIAMLTVGQLQKFLQGEKIESTKVVLEQKKYVYGLAGIRRLFNVSHVTAQKYKDTIIADACFQQGRKIVVDVDKAMELFKNQSKKGGTI
jgi:hypothetical protein